MKLLHTADLHLGALNKRLTPTKATAVKDEQILQIGDFFEYAKQNSVEAILISGDLFHNKIIPLKTQKVFFDYVRNSGIKTFYLRGNHDKEYFSKQLMPDNFIMFEEELETYSFDKFTISGQQACAKMQKPIFLDDKFHFMMLHGDIYNRNSQDGIDLEYYKNLKINYLALGHIHNFSSGNLDKDGVYVYSGSMFSNGFDECNKKGFVEIKNTGELVLTDVGRQKAENIFERHRVLMQALIKLGAEEESAEENACRIEHVITDDIFEIVKNFVAKQ